MLYLIFVCKRHGREIALLLSSTLFMLALDLIANAAQGHSKKNTPRKAKPPLKPNRMPNGTTGGVSTGAPAPPRPQPEGVIIVSLAVSPAECSIFMFGKPVQLSHPNAFSAARNAKRLSVILLINPTSKILQREVQVPGLEALVCIQHGVFRNKNHQGPILGVQIANDVVSSIDVPKGVKVFNLSCSSGTLPTFSNSASELYAVDSKDGQTSLALLMAWGGIIVEMLENGEKSGFEKACNEFEFMKGKKRLQKPGMDCGDRLVRIR